MHRDIKTRNVIKGTIKQLDRGISSSHRIRETYAKTKERVDTANQPEEDSPTEYANECALRGGRIAVEKSASRIQKTGKQGVEALKAYRRKTNSRNKEFGFKAVNPTEKPMTQRKNSIRRKPVTNKRSSTGEKYLIGARNSSSVAKAPKVTRYASRGIKTTSKTSRQATNQAIKATRASKRLSMMLMKTSATTAKFAGVKGIVMAKVAIKASALALKAIVTGTKALIIGIVAGGWIAVLIILICVLFGSALFLFGNNNSSNHTSVSREVLAYEPIIREIAREHGIEEFTLLIMAVMMQESGGRGSDPMQSSESPYNTRFPNTPNSITDPIYSIEVGIRHLRSSLQAAQVENPIDMERIPLALQGYNFGNHYIPWAIENFGVHSMASAVAFSEMMAERLGWASYGDTNYPSNVLRYYPLGRHTNNSGQFVLPVGGNWRITSHFGYRNDPFTGERKFHEGTDFATDIPNAPIYSIGDGTVVLSRWAGGYGNYIVIQHDETTFSGYGHNQRNLVQVGDRVTAGQQIAIMGTTGVSTGVHLHLNIMMNTTDYWGEYVNPVEVLGIE